MPCIVYSGLGLEWVGGWGWEGGGARERERERERQRDRDRQTDRQRDRESSELYYSRTEILGNSPFLQTCPCG